jgi:hypothetical protein
MAKEASKRPDNNDPDVCERLSKIERRLAKIESKLGGIAEDVKCIHGTVQTLPERFACLENRFTLLEEIVECVHEGVKKLLAAPAGGMTAAETAKVTAELEAHAGRLDDMAKGPANVP